MISGHGCCSLVGQAAPLASRAKITLAQAPRRAFGTEMAPPWVRSRSDPSCTTSTCTLPPPVVASIDRKREGPRACSCTGAAEMAAAAAWATVTAKREEGEQTVGAHAVEVISSSTISTACRTHRDSSRGGRRAAPAPLPGHCCPTAQSPRARRLPPSHQPLRGAGRCAARCRAPRPRNAAAIGRRRRRRRQGQGRRRWPSSWMALPRCCTHSALLWQSLGRAGGCGGGWPQPIWCEPAYRNWACPGACSACQRCGWTLAAPGPMGMCSQGR